jgi:hypothetical protein
MRCLNKEKEMKKITFRAALVCFVALAAFAFVHQAAADLAPLSISGMVMSDPDLGTMSRDFQYSEFELEDGGKKWKMKDVVLMEGVWMGSADITIEEIEFDPDPIVYQNILVSNTSGSNQTYSLTLNLATTWAGPLQMRGSIDTSVIGTDASLQAPMGGSVYTALIDGSPVKTLQDAPFALGTGQDATTSATNFTWESVGGNVTSSIGITLTFALSPGDTAAILSDFEVIPEPASAALIGVVVSGLVFIRRRFLD